MNSDDVLIELIQIRRGLEALLQRGGGRFSITPENALPHVILWQSYPVEDVARIAASCAGQSHQERIIEALKLLEAAERIANPDLWEDQHLQRQEGDELGDIPDFDAEQVMFELEQAVPEIIREATNDAGEINRLKLCKIACVKAGRDVSDDRVEKLFLREWLPQAAESRARWELFRQMKHEADLEREELKSAIAKGSSKKAVEKLREKVAATEAISFSNGGVFYPAAAEIDRRRKALTDDERKVDYEAFRGMLEAGTHNQPRIIHTEDHARAILLGAPDFAGFLKFVKFPEEKSKYTPTPPRLRGGDGTFAKLDRDADGKMKAIRDVSANDETPMPAAPKGHENPLEGKKWKKRR